MSTVFISIIIIAALVLVIFFLTRLNAAGNKRKRQVLADQLQEAGKELNLSFLRTEPLKSRILGFAPAAQILVLVQEIDQLADRQVIDLKEVKSCRCSRIYYQSPAKTGNEKGDPAHLSSVVLQFHFKNVHQPVVSVPFYQSLANSIYELDELEQKAKVWESLISKSLAPNSKIA